MSDTNRPPLWQVMAGAWSARVIVGRPDAERLAIAAEIRALRDWLTPEVAEPLQPCPGSSWGRWHERQRLRALLAAEADRAERGDG